MCADYGGPMSETPIVQKGLVPLPEPVKGAVVTVSDRCVSGEREDLSGPLAQRLLAEHDVVVEKVDLVPDGIEPVRKAILRAVADGARVVLTTGGTGVTPRDLTPEATAPLLATRLEGIEAQIRAHGLSKTPLAGLSRGLVGVTSRTPSPSSARWCPMSSSSSAAVTTEPARRGAGNEVLVTRVRRCPRRGPRPRCPGPARRRGARVSP